MPKTAARKATTPKAAPKASAPKAVVRPARKAAAGGGSLVIVESPAKAKTIEKYLGPDYTVRASYGHIRDLPKSNLGVDVDRIIAEAGTYGAVTVSTQMAGRGVDIRGQGVSSAGCDGIRGDHLPHAHIELLRIGICAVVGPRRSVGIAIQRRQGRQLVQRYGPSHFGGRQIHCRDLSARTEDQGRGRCPGAVDRG